MSRKPLHASAVVHQPRDMVSAALPRILPHHCRFDAKTGMLHIDLPPHAIAELAATPINSEHLSAPEERWYPRFFGTIGLAALHDAGTDVTITGQIEHGTAAYSDAHFEREIAQRALTNLLCVLQRHFA